MSKRHLTQEEKHDIACIFRAKKANQSELAMQFGASRTAIRRVLNEYGLVTFSTEATKKERSMLDAIQFYGIENVDKLRQVLQRGIQC